MQLISKDGRKAIPRLGGTGKNPGGKPDRKVIGPLIRGMILRINVLQYSSKFDNSQRSLLSPTGLRKSYVKTMATVYTAVRTNEMNYSITNKDWNDAYNKQDNMHNKYTNDDVDARNFDGRVAHHNMH